jgi:ADP-ribose pyrophosphatase
MADSELCDQKAEAEVAGPEVQSGRLYRYERYRVTPADRGDGALTRDVVRVGRVVVIVPLDIKRDEIVLIRQFRLGAHLAIGRGDMVELPAGRVEPGEELIEAAARECEEEIGVAPRTLTPIFDVMPSPGMSDEHMSFFLGTVDASKVLARAGASHEREETRPIRVPITRALAALQTGGLHYGAGVLGLQWLALNRGRLGDIARRGTSAASTVTTPSLPA